MPEILITHLEPDSRNANVCDSDVLNKIERHIKRTGLCPTLVVRKHPDKKNKYIIIDGHHRMVILKRLKWKKVPCQVWDVDDTEAVMALTTLNRLRGTDNPVKRAELFDVLTEQFSLPELSDLVPENQSEISALLALIQLDQDEAEKIIEAQIKKEKNELPIPFGCLLTAKENRLVLKALKCFEGKQSTQLVAMSKFLLKRKERIRESKESK